MFPLPELPMVPGREVAGVVDAVGPGVDAGWTGRRVVAHLGMANGGYAELAVAAAGALHEIPDGLSAEVAVAAIGTGRTAVAILKVATLTRDDVVLVTAAASGNQSDCTVI
jgi:NADPH:quinone reductase